MRKKHKPRRKISWFKSHKRPTIFLLILLTSGLIIKFAPGLAIIFTIIASLALMAIVGPYIFILLSKRIQ